MSKGIFGKIAGAYAPTPGVGAAIIGLSEFLISSAAGLVLSALGTIFQKGPLQGFATTERNPIAPWNVIYGRKREGGTLVYDNSFGDNDKYRDLVIVLACHPCQAVDWLLFDQQKVQIGRNNTSFSPVQQDPSNSSIARVGNIVTVHVSKDIPLLSVGDSVIVQNVHPVSAGLNGKVMVQTVTHGPGNTVTFTYVSGGVAISIPSFPGSETGDTHTAWVDYRGKIYMEVMLGSQTLGQTFNGMINGTPYDGDAGNLVHNNTNPWTANCSLVGMTAVFLRLHYNDEVFANGLPQISFLVRGKNDIFDPRTSTSGYSENAALCTADHLANKKWGFKANYGTDIPSAPLIAAANICDEAVPLATGGTEPRYTCNGGFQLTMKRGEILHNMLTSCAGRITYVGGQFVIWPAHWAGVSTIIGVGGTPSLATEILSLSTGGPRWRPTVSISNRYNGVKGTYISPSNGWMAADFPRYAQDTYHGYTWGAGPTFDANLDYDGGDRRWLDIQLPFTNSAATAQRIAKIELLRRLNMGTGSFMLNMTGYQLAPLDVISMDFPYFGWSAKTLEIQAFRFKMDRQSGHSGQDVTLLGTEIDVQETDSSIYAWVIGEELSPDGFQQAISPDTRNPAPPTNVRVTGDHERNVILSWTAPADSYVINGGHLEPQYQLLATPPGIWISLGKIDPKITSIPIPGLTAGQQFTVRIRSVNAAGIPSAWVIAQGGPVAIVPIGQWAPFQVQASASDALFPSEWTFDLSQTYTMLADGSAQAFANATGKFPCTTFIPGTVAMSLMLSNISVLPTGGFLKGGTTVWLALGAQDANRNQIPPSKIVAVSIPAGTNTNKIVIGPAQASIAGLFAAQPGDGNQVQIAGKLYTFQTTLTNVDGNVAIGVDLPTSISNFAAAVNLGAGSGSAYAAATTANGSATAALAADNVSIQCTAITAGLAGNSLTASGIAIWGNMGVFYGGADIIWPSAGGLTTYTIFASYFNDLICEQATGALTASSPPDNYTPGSVTLTGPLARSTWALPDDQVNDVILKYKPIGHAGVEGATVGSIVGNTIISPDCVDVSLTDNWAGRFWILMGRNNAAAPFSAYSITAFDPATGTFTLDRTPSDILIGDVFAVSFKGYDNSGSNTVFTDAGMSNSQNIDQITGIPNPHAGLNINFEVGLFGLIWAGFNRGATAKVVANGHTGYTFDQPLLMDATSVPIIVGPSWFPFSSTPIGDNPDPQSVSTITIPTINYVRKQLLIGAFTDDLQGTESLDGDEPLRLLYVYGLGLNTRVVTADTTVLQGDRSIGCDTTAGNIIVHLLPSAQTKGQILFVQKISVDANIVTILPFGTETINGAASVVLTNVWDVAQIVSNG